MTEWLRIHTNLANIETIMRIFDNKARRCLPRDTESRVGAIAHIHTQMLIISAAHEMMPALSKVEKKTKPTIKSSINVYKCEDYKIAKIFVLIFIDPYLFFLYPYR